MGEDETLLLAVMGQCMDDITLLRQTIRRRTAILVTRKNPFTILSSVTHVST